MSLPISQVHKGQPRPAELLIQPNAEVMQGKLRGQARLQPTECMGPFSIQPKATRPGSQPAPRRVASRVGTPELSRASSAQRWAAKTWTRDRKNATKAVGC